MSRVQGQTVDSEDPIVLERTGKLDVARLNLATDVIARQPSAFRLCSTSVRIVK